MNGVNILDMDPYAYKNHVADSQPKSGKGAKARTLDEWAYRCPGFRRLEVKDGCTSRRKITIIVELCEIIVFAKHNFTARQTVIGLAPNLEKGGFVIM